MDSIAEEVKEVCGLSRAKIDLLSAKYHLDHSFDNTQGKRTTPEEIIKYFAEYGDPTNKKIYTDWIIRQYSNKEFRQEDTERVSKYLTMFETYKSKMENKDILKYKTLTDLRDAINEHAKTTSAVGADYSIVEIPGATKMWEDENIAIIRLDTIEASCIIGRGTEWCTATQKNDGTPTENNHFESYSSRGPLFVILSKIHKHKDGNFRRWQYHVQDEQFMDENDHDICKEDFDLIKHSFWKAWDENPQVISDKVVK